VEAHKRYLGVSVYPFALTGEVNDSAIIYREFDCITPGSAMKWKYTEPHQDEYTFNDADLIVKLAEEHGQKLRGHTLVWHQSLPEWVAKEHLTQEQLSAAMKKHITTLVSRWKGKLFAWDVANEV